MAKHASCEIKFDILQFYVEAAISIRGEYNIFISYCFLLRLAVIPPALDFQRGYLQSAFSPFSRFYRCRHLKLSDSLDLLQVRFKDAIKTVKYGCLLQLFRFLWSPGGVILSSTNCNVTLISPEFL